MNVKALLQRHPVLFYFILAYAIAWGFCIAAVGTKFLRGEPLQFTDLMLMLLPMLAGPSIAGITMTTITDGRRGLQDLLSRMGKWRVGVRWYALAILIPPVLILPLLLMLANLASPAFFPRFSPMGFIYGILVGFFEEIGWMGFAFPKMQLKRSAFSIAIYLGLLWAMWHLVADYLGASGVFGVYWLPHFLVWMVATFTAMRVLIVWVYSNTRSLLLCQLMHASSTGFLYVLGPSLAPTEDILFYGLYAVVLWLAVIIVVKRYGKNLVRQPE